MYILSFKIEEGIVAYREFRKIEKNSLQGIKIKDY